MNLPIVNGIMIISILSSYISGYLIISNIKKIKITAICIFLISNLCLLIEYFLTGISAYIFAVLLFGSQNIINLIRTIKK